VYAGDDEDCKFTISNTKVEYTIKNNLITLAKFVGLIHRNFGKNLKPKKFYLPNMPKLEDKT